MSRIDTNFVKQLYSQAGVELTPEKLDHISNNYSSNEELQSAFELKYGSMNASTPEKKNSDVTSVSTSEAPQSESQQPQKKASSLSVGGKPIRTGDLESSVGDDKVIYINKDPKRGKVDDMSTPPPAGYRYQVVQNSVQLKKWKEQKSKINNESPFGPPIQTFQEQKSQEFKEVKKKEESKKKEALKSMPILGKDVKLNVPKADTKTTDLSGVKKVEIKPLTKTDQVSKNQVVNVAYDYAVNNLDTSLSEEKYQDEINEKQFTDGIKQGLINIYNDVIGNPLSSVTNLDLVVKKSKPLENQYKEIAKIEQKEKVSYSPELKAKMAKDMFIEEENKKQMYTLIDKALPSGYDREGVWKELKLQSIKSNDQLRSTIASAEVFKGKINQFNDFFKENYKDLNKIEGGNEDKGNKYVFEIGGKKITLSESKYQEYEKLRQEAIDAKSKLESMSLDIDKIYNKASKDDELLDLFKYNYNDFQATKDRVLGGVGEIIGGGLKLLGEGSNYIEDKIGFAPGLALIPGISDKAVETGNALLDISQEKKEQYLRYNASDLTWDNLPSFGLQLFSEQLPVFLSIGLAGPGGLAAVSAGSGGRQFRDLEIEEQNNPFVRYSQGQKLTSAFLYGGAEYAGEFFGTRVLLKGFGNTIRNASLQNRRLFYDGMIKSTIKSLPKVATGAGVEGGSELATATMQIGVDLGVLGKEVKSKEAFERLYEATAAGVGMGVGMSVVANNMQLVAAQSKVFSTRQDMRKVGNLLNEIDVLNQELNNNPLLSEEDKAIIYKDMNSKTNEAFNIVSKNSAREKDFTIQEKAELLNINARQIELKEDYDKITDSNISEKIKKQKIDELNNKFNALEAKRNDILNKTYNEFNYLPESEKISLKNKAAEAIIQEQLDKGVERDNIQEPNPEVINKKAIEIYESNKQTTGQVSEQEKPATTTETETTDATQAGTETKPQEKINSVESDLNNNNLSKIEISLSRQGFVGDFLNDYEFLAEGSEHIVYRSKDGKTVIKIGEPYGSNEGFMPRVKDAILINSLIGDGSLEVIGYYEQNGVKNPIYKQNYLKGEIASQAEVSSYLESKGFLNIGNDNFVANVDGKFLRISDTSDNFIKDKDGNIFAIDAGIVEISENDLTDTQKQEINKITNKTETDAVQEQITDEGVLQPEQSKMGLQEMEQGDKINQVVAEQGEEKVSTKVSDSYTSNEVERVKTLPKESEDGATMNLDGSKYEGGGLVIPLASKNMDASELTPEAIQEFIDENAESIGEDNVKVGIYKFPNSNQVSIDISIVADPSMREEGIAIGKELGQESLFDLDTFENVKTGADGMNPKKLSPSEFRDIQQRLKPKSKGVEVSKDTNEAKKQLSKVENKKVAKAIINGVKSISKLLPNVKVIIHDTDDSFRSVSGESKNQESSGLYKNGEIHINLPKANSRTVAHEIFHAILLDKVKTDTNAQTVTKKMIESIASKIDGNPDLKAKLEDFASMYDENIQDEEKLAELVGIMAQNYDSFSTRVKEIIKNWLNNLAKTFGVELFESNEVFDVLNTIAKKVAAGSVINESDADIFVTGNVSSVLNIKDSAKPRKSIVGDIIRFDVNKNTKVTENVSLSKFNGKNVNLFESDRMTGGYIKNDSNVILFKFLGGVSFPSITGKWWASQNETKAKSIANNSNVNRDADGYIYGTPMVGSEKQHMSNNDMLLATVELMKLDATSRNTNVTKSDVINLINKAFKKKGLESKNPIIKSVIKKSNSIADVFNELEYVLFQENDSIVDKSGNSILDANGSKISKLTFEERKSIIETLLGNATVRDVNFPSAGNAYDAALRFAEPITQKAKKIGDIVTVMRTKGTLKYKKTDKSDEFYHKSYPYEIYAENEDGSLANIEMFILDAAYSLKDVFPKLKKSSGETFTWDEYLAKHGPKSEKFAESQYNRTAKLSNASGNINIRQQKALPEKVAEKLTEDGDGNFVFKHYSDQRRDVIKKGQGTNRITSREEASALGAVGGLAMFYTMEGQVEAGVGNVEHTILVSKDKVYDIDSDPLGFEKEARKRFNEVRPGQAFTNNHRGAFITQVANENGFDVAVTQWRGSELRAQSTKELTPSEKSVEFKDRPLDTFNEGDYAIIDGRESLITNVDGNKLRYESLDGVAKGTTINNERNRRNIVKIDKPSVRMQKPSKQSSKEKRQELSDAKKEIQSIFSAAKEALKIEKDRNKVIDGLKKDVNKFIKSAIQDLEAGDIGKRAISSIISKVQSVTDQNFEEKLLEVNDILDNLYTNRDVNKAKTDSKNAYSNVMSGNVGKLDKEGDMDKVMSSKVVGLTMLDPNILKKVLSDVDFSQYKDYINRLAERSLAIKETDLKAINELYDRIIGPYTDHVSEVNRIQQIIDAGGTLSSAESKFVEDNKSEFSERETPESIAEKEAKKADRDAKKQAEIAEKKRKIKELLPFISDVFASSIAEKGSIEWDILENLSNLTDDDIESMPENMLNNVFNALNSMVYNDVLVSYANEIHKYKLKQDYKKTFAETLSKAGKKGIYKAKLIKPLLKIREVVGLPMSAIWKGIKNGNLKQEIIDRRIKFFNFSSIDAAVKVYGETPIFNNIMSRFGKAMARVSSAEEKAETILLKVKKDLDKKSKNPQESYMKIVYHLIDAMAKNNVGAKSEVSAMEYFEATLSDPNSKIAENNRAKELIQAFVNKVKANNNEIEELTKEELNAVNAIRKVLDDNKINAYEANFFQNSNASPMINAYYPVMNSLKNQAEQDLVKLKNRFGISNVVSIKSGNLEEKTGTAHPIDMNPFSTAFSSIKSTIFQHQLRTEYQALKQALSELEIENTNNKEVLSYLSGIKKAVDSQFELLTNGVVGTEQTLADDILNAMDKSFYTLALGSVVSRGVDFLGNMVQLATISPKILSNNRRVLNNLLAIKKDDESGTEILRNFYKNAEASDINKMISSKKISTERTEFMNRGANRGVLSKGLPSSNIGTKIKARITDPITSATSGAVDLLLGFGDVKPYGMSWNGVFYEEFKKQAGVEVDVEKIARGDVEYLKRYKDAIKKASNKANQENADLYGSTNPMEKKVGIMEIAKKPVKSSLAGAIGALRNKAAYLFSSFDMNARNAINTSINTYIENQDSREARKLIGGAVRLAMYSASINYITSALWNAFKGDDDDEDELKKSFDKLSDNDDFIKYVNSSLLDFPIQKDAEGNIIQLNIDDLARYNEMRDKLMSNKEFAKAYDIMYGYLNRDLFDIQVRSKVNQINQGNYEYDRSVVDGFFTDIDNGFGKSGEDIIEVLGILNSEQGYKMFTQEEIDENILKVEEYMSKIDFLNNRAIRESGGAIDRLLITKVASTLSDYRTDTSLESVRNTEGLKLLMGMMFSRSNNFGKAAANYSAEFANKLITESKRGERGYDVYKDGIFQSPVKYKLKEDASLIDDAVNVLFPVFQKFDKYRYSDYSLPDLIRFTPMGILGVNDLAKINSKMKNDVIYQETNGKYKENILKDISKTKIDILRDKKKVEQDRLDEQFKKSRVIPGVKETKLKSRFPSYKENKDLKVNGRSAN